jgi:serine/threonine protein kinase
LRRYSINGGKEYMTKIPCCGMIQSDKSYTIRDYSGCVNDWSEPLLELVYTNVTSFSDEINSPNNILKRCQENDRVSDVENKIEAELGIDSYDLEIKMVRAALEDLFDIGAVSRKIVLIDEDSVVGDKSEDSDNRLGMSYTETTIPSSLALASPRIKGIDYTVERNKFEVDQPFVKGDTLCERYEMQEALDSGVSGTLKMTGVWKASDKKIGESVILKYGFDSFESYIEKEKGVLRSIEEGGGHENIISLRESTRIGHPSIENERASALIKEYVLGQTLDSYISKNKDSTENTTDNVVVECTLCEEEFDRDANAGFCPECGGKNEYPVEGIRKDVTGEAENSPVVDQEMVYKIGLQLADALGTCHNQDIVVRGLRPADIILTNEMKPVITDFGLAFKHITADDRPEMVCPEPGCDGKIPQGKDYCMDCGHKRDEEVGYTALPGYWYPPEVRDPLSYEKKPGFYSDTYTLGMILFYTLTGSLTKPSGNGLDPTDDVTSINNSFGQIIKEATSPDLQERFSTGVEMKEALDNRVYLE